MRAQNGIVQWINKPFGLAFIRPEGSADMILAPLRNFFDPVGIKTLKVGMRVEFSAKRQRQRTIICAMAVITT